MLFGWVSFVVAAVCLTILGRVWRQWRAGVREALIRRYTLPAGIFPKLRQKHPDLTQKDCQLVAQALRQYFLTYLKSGYRSVSMPSQVVDDLWHEFILYTRTYERFCQQAFGRFMHHTPAAVLGSVDGQNAGLRRCWRYACREEGINPGKPTRLPLLFAIDGKLNIDGGFRYALDCQALGRVDAQGRPVHCGGDFGPGCGTGSGGDGGGRDGDGSGGAGDHGHGNSGDAGSAGGDSGCSGGCGGGD